MAVAPYVLDLACGLGSITDRVLERFPRRTRRRAGHRPRAAGAEPCRSRHDSRVTVVEADLSTPAWLQALADEPFDAVLTATALHWLPAERVRRLYAEVVDGAASRGCLLNADHMPSERARCESASATTSLLGSVRPSHSPQRSTGRLVGGARRRAGVRCARRATQRIVRWRGPPCRGDSRRRVASAVTA